MRPGDRTMWHSAVGWIVTLTLGFLAAPLEVDAQPSAKGATIGYLSLAGSVPLAEAFRQGLQDLGYVEGKTIAIVYRSAEGKPERLPALAAELAQLPVDVIVATTGLGAQAAKNTTTTIPIVMVSGADPVAIGLVASLARPGGNITGLSLMNAELAGKQLQLLKEATASLARVAVLWNARDAVMTNIFSAIATMTEERPDALFMITDVLTSKFTRQVVDFAAQRQLPTMFQSSGPVAEGGLMFYGPSPTDAYRRAAYYVDRILKGAKPGDLPVEQPTKFELVVNLKTAKALGITMPPTLLMLADKVIE
jgi:putative ABC transport system substrate-binding protein